MVAKKPRTLVVLFARSRSPVVLVVVLIICALVLGRRMIFVVWRSVLVDAESYLLVVVGSVVYFTVAFTRIVFDKKVFGRFVDVES